MNILASTPCYSAPRQVVIDLSTSPSLSGSALGYPASSRNDDLAARLSFPFDGDFQQRAEPLPRPRCVTVVRLLQKAGVNESDGILCKAATDKGARGVPLAAVRVVPSSANSQLIADYCYWLWTYR